MSLRPYNPLHSLSRMMQEVDLLQKSLSGGDFLAGFKDNDFFQRTYPQMTIQEHPDHWEYRFDIPGVKKEDLKITRVGNTVTVKGVRAERKTKKDDEKHYYYSESHYGSFDRSFTLEDNAKPSSLVAKTSTGNGVLVITVAKKDVVAKDEAVNVTVE